MLTWFSHGMFNLSNHICFCLIGIFTTVLHYAELNVKGWKNGHVVIKIIY